MCNALRYVAVRWRITDQPVLCAEKMRTHRAALPEKEVWTMTDLKCSVETCCFHDGDCCCRNDIMVGLSLTLMKIEDEAWLEALESPVKTIAW